LARKAVAADYEAVVSAGTSSVRGPSAVFHRDALLSRVEGDLDLLRMVLDVFLKDAPEQIRALKAARARGSTEDIRRQAHSLKSAAGSAGALDLQKLAQSLELAGDAGDLDSIATLLSEIDLAFDKLKEALIGQGLLVLNGTERRVSDAESLDSGG